MLEPKNFENFSIEALTFVIKEGNDMLDDTIKSFREGINKSFIVVAVIIGALTYYTKDVSEHGFCFSNIIGGFGSIICILVIFRNLLPDLLNIKGGDISNYIHPFYSQEAIKNDQLRQMYVSKLIGLEKATSNNKRLIEKRSKRFNTTIILFSIVSLLSYCAVIIK